MSFSKATEEVIRQHEANMPLIPIWKHFYEVFEGKKVFCICEEESAAISAYRSYKAEGHNVHIVECDGFTSVMPVSQIIRYIKPD